MKRIISLLMSLSLLVISYGQINVYGEEEVDTQETGISVYYESTEMNFDTQPMDTGDVIIVPLRQLCENLGAQITWDFAFAEATVVFADKTLKLKENTDTAILNGEEKILPHRVISYEGVLYAPVRFVAESLGKDVEWDEENNAVIIGDDLGSADIGNIYNIIDLTASEDDGNKPENVLDRNYDSRWSAESNGSYITLELDDVHPVAYVGVACYTGEERSTTLSVQVSKNGTDFNEVVTRWVSNRTNNMEPIDLGGVYDAKYVRILGYGNTSNQWTSLTELSVYGPYEDGTMPVANDGPGSTADVSSLSAEDYEILKNFDEKYYSRIYIWLANLYDPESGGFYDTISGKDDPELDTAIEMTVFALNNIIDYSDANVENIPDNVRQGFVNYLIERQDPQTGNFIDKQGIPDSSREVARNQMAGLGMVNRWKIELPYMHPSMRAAEENTESASSTSLKPEYVDSVDAYIDWIESWDWDSNSWTGGDQLHQSMSNINYYVPESQRQEYFDALLDWLAERQFEDTGLWAPKIDFNSISGVFKIMNIYSEFGGMRLPNVDKILDSVIKVFDVDTPTTAHYLRNPISVLNKIATYGPEYAEKTKQALINNMDKLMKWVDLFYCPDGGFSMYYHKSMATFGGVVCGHQLWEGDVDSTSMMLTFRKEVYNLMGVSAPKIKVGEEEYWKYFTGEVEIPSPYIDEQYENVQTTESSNQYSQDFEGIAAGTILNGNEFGGSSSEMKAMIVSDRDKLNNNILALSYDGTSSTGPSFIISMGESANSVRYIPDSKETVVIEYDIRIDGGAKSNNFYILHGESTGYALNFGGVGNQNLATRIDTTNVAYGGSYYTLKSGEWYRIRLESKNEGAADTYLTKVYVDGELVAKNNYSYLMLSSNPGSIYGSITLTWYKAGVGTVYLDNIIASKN